MTCSPFKNSPLNVSKTRRAKDPAGSKGNLCNGPTVGRQSYSGKKKKRTTKTKKKKKKKKKRRTFPVQGVMSNMKT